MSKKNIKEEVLSVKETQQENNKIKEVKTIYKFQTQSKVYYSHSKPCFDDRGIVISNSFIEEKFNKSIGTSINISVSYPSSVNKEDVILKTEEGCSVSSFLEDNLDWVERSKEQAKDDFDKKVSAGYDEYIKLVEAELQREKGVNNQLAESMETLKEEIEQLNETLEEYKRAILKYRNKQQKKKFDF